MGCGTVGATTQREMFYGETQEKHTAAVKLPGSFFSPLHFRVKSGQLFVFIFIFRCYGLLREKAVPFPSNRN